MTASRVRGGVALILAGSLLHTGDLRANDDALAAALPKLSAWSARFETMINRATFTMSGYTVVVGDDGKTSGRKEGTFRVDNRGRRAHFEVVRYTEDGEDKTEEAREKLRKDEKARAEEEKDPEDEIHLPFLASELPKYSFRVGETDPRAPSRVRLYFTARHPAKNLGIGSAWVDTRTGEVFSIGVSPSKTSLFVDYMNVTLEFGEPTPMGPGLSRMGFESRGGFWFLSKKIRGVAKLSDYDVR